ncbi:hypothetical protein ACH5RR_027068 [Cinchona calisaya]|uniref:BHLH domain-containing protein n=1 Tax=Cinchona calisaya TaxID=153742 RepID=A0ABD2Z4D0_9GENT
MGFQQGGGGDSLLNWPSSGRDTNSMSDKVAGVAMRSESMFKSSTGVDPFFGGSGWDPLVSLNHGESFGDGGGSSVVVPHHHIEFGNTTHYQVGLENQATSSTSHLVHYVSDSSGLGDMMPKISCFGSGTFPEMVNSFGLPDSGQVTETSFHTKYAQKKGGHEDCQTSEQRALGGNGKKKRKASDSHSPLNPKKNVEGEQQKDLSGNSTSECSKEQDEMKQKTEQSNSTNLHNKRADKQVKENSNTGEPSKETYIHVRAKGGQATNSHSLAERVRRERISERMRLLQELVPGCNKITGKAVMLDEIINYVQSLQQQVEFLSMKLATVNPELNIDLDRIFSKDILHSQGSNAATLGIGPGLNSSHPFPGYSQGSFPVISNATAPFHPIPQTLWDNELQSIFQMGFDPNTSINHLKPNGQSKLEP